MFKNILRYILGFLYLIGGIAKFFPQGESVEIVLKESADANQKNWLALPSNWFYEHYFIMTWFVAISMITIGAVIIINRFLVKEALYASLFMIGSFMLFLCLSAPKIFIVDIPFIAAAIYLLKKNNNVER